jgi:4-hydroxymandelate synthase
MHVTGIDHVEFYVGDAAAAAAQLRASYGFRISGELGPETGLPGERSVLVRQRDIQLVLTTGLAPGHPATEYVARHGDGLATIALATDDPDGMLMEAVAGGAVPLSPPGPLDDPPATGRVRIAGFGDVGHTFVAPGELAARFARARPVRGAAAHGSGDLDLLDAVDHVAACVPAGELLSTVAFYERVLGFRQIFEEYIEVGGQAMNSKVVQSRSGEVTLTLLEPDPDGLPGQIDDFLAAHAGAGVQHLAFRTDDIAAAVRALSGRGVGFLSTPGSYYDELERRLGRVGVPLAVLRELNVLVDRDNVGELFQIFTQSTHPRRTFFIEVIERRDALTFGSANIKALYQAVERERARTGPGAVVAR